MLVQAFSDLGCRENHKVITPLVKARDYLEKSCITPQLAAKLHMDHAAPSPPISRHSAFVLAAFVVGLGNYPATLHIQGPTAP